MIPIRALAALGWTLAWLTPTAAETYRVVNADKPAEFLNFDCSQDPTGRDFAWVTDNCRLVSASTAPAGKVTVRGWDPKQKEEIVGEPERRNP